MTTYLTVLEVITMNQELLEQAGQGYHLLNEGALEGAVMRPQMVAHYGQADLVEQAATLIAGIALAHAFLDGNKRTAYVAGLTFLRLNGFRVDEDPVEIALQVEAIITRQGSLEEATARFVEWLRPRVVLLD
jgi:death-on-curing protein